MLFSIKMRTWKLSGACVCHNVDWLFEIRCYTLSCVTPSKGNVYLPGVGRYLICPSAHGELSLLVMCYKTCENRNKMGPIERSGKYRCNLPNNLLGWYDILMQSKIIYINATYGHQSRIPRILGSKIDPGVVNCLH